MAITDILYFSDFAHQNSKFQFIKKLIEYEIQNFQFIQKMA